MAKSVKALITPEVLKSVRENHLKLEIGFAAKKLKVKPDQLESWETGTDFPTFAQLKRIANCYKTHLSVFYLPEAPASFEHPVDNRRFPESDIPDSEQTYRLNVNILEAYERRERLVDLYHLLEESPPEVELDLNEADEPERAAKQIENFLQLNKKELYRCNEPYSALKFWKRTVEEKGILVCQTSVNSHLSIKLETVRGFCIAQRPLPVIVVNPKDSPYGRIFTIMHELVHIGLGLSVIQNSDLKQGRPSDNPTEVFCNQVSAEVLVPADELSARVNLHTLETDLPQLSKHFRVSPEVIMRRLDTLRYISPQKYHAYRNRLLEEFQDSPVRSGGAAPYHTRLLNAAGEHFGRVAFTAYYEQKITLADLASAFSKCDTKHLPKIESAIFA